MYKNFLKNIIDKILAIFMLPLLLIMSIIIWILIKIDDNGPLFFKGERIGKNQEIFKMYKFRSMKVGAENILNSDGSTFNSSDDRRLTKIGKYLRESSLDELPQILNVIKGDMSLIGPRASLAEALYTYQIDEKDKMKVKPGITGYTQAFYRNSINVREKRLKDSWYANNLSFVLDFKILLKTVLIVLKKENIYSNKN